jgi:hypothetical protein
MTVVLALESSLNLLDYICAVKYFFYSTCPKNCGYTTYGVKSSVSTRPGPVQRRPEASEERDWFWGRYGPQEEEKFVQKTFIIF